jgi:hypothetical protein
MRFFFAPPQEGNLTNNIIQYYTQFSRRCASRSRGSIGSTVPVVWKEDTVVFVRDRIRVERSALGFFSRNPK